MIFQALRTFLIVGITILWLSPMQLEASSIDGKKVTFQKLMDIMLYDKPDTAINNDGSKDLIIRLNNVEVQFNRVLDNDLDQRYLKGGPKMIVKHTIYFTNCTFPVDFWYLLRNVEFEGYFVMFGCTNVKSIFKECVFKKTVRIYNSSVDFLQFDDCNFKHGFKMARTGVADYVKFNQCNFEVDPKHIYDNPNIDMEARLFTFQNKLDPIDLSFERCHFRMVDSLKNDPQYIINLSASNYNNLKFNDCSTNVPVNFSQSSVVNQFTCFNSNFESHVFVEAFNFNPANAKVQWSSIEGGKIAIQTPGSPVVITGASVKELREEFLYNSLVSCYAMFYNAYRLQGNRISANASYKEWKDIETIYLRHLVDKKYNFNTYFNWLMNVFLDTFCDYGTNPIKSIKWSFYVMVFFAGFYLFFPYQGGAFNRDAFYLKISMYVKYFTSRKSLLQIYEETRSSSHERRASFLADLEMHKEKLPFFVKVFGKPIFGLAGVKEKMHKVFYRILDSTTGTWEEQEGKRKFFASTVYAMIILFILLVFIVQRVFDCLALSLNAFSTLGFGEIPVKGAAQYLTVMEGFIGWFLLSIFSVALISQIIQ